MANPHRHVAGRDPVAFHLNQSALRIRFSSESLHEFSQYPRYEDEQAEEPEREGDPKEFPRLLRAADPSADEHRTEDGRRTHDEKLSHFHGSPQDCETLPSHWRMPS